MRMDQCFGAFVDFLHDARLWDDSIVILTADHGDSLGEGGRWGHAYTIYPEVIRIPLIVHVPQQFLNGRVIDLNRLAFSTDLTPTLYDLLGHELTETSPLFGRSLLPLRGQTQTPKTGLIVSSYGPVFGWLSHQGRSLFIADAINYREESFRIPLEGPAVAEEVTDDVHRSGRAAIKEATRMLDTYYRVPLRR